MRRLLVLPLILFCTTFAPAQEPSAAPSPDFSREAFVVELVSNLMRYESDGTSWLRRQGRFRVRTEAGVQQVGLLRFGYNAATEEIDINYVRVRKPDGTVVDTPIAGVPEFPSELTRLAPMYTDFREKHVTVSALRPGDALEFESVTRGKIPLIPGHFWLQFSFEKNAVVLQEEWTVDVPAERRLRLKTAPGHDPEVEEKGGRRLYRWRSANLEPKRDEKAKPTPESEDSEEKEIGFDVQFSTFQSWEEVGGWYRGIQQVQEVVSPEIRAKAEELTSGLATDTDKIHALYDFVSKDFRYVAVSFGLGRLQPHPAPEVFANHYGDCKDKHTLLAAMLKAVGLRAYPALIHSQRKLDLEVPSPAQFDHLITVVPTPEGYLWLDTTTEVAPFRLLAAFLRDKQALVMPEGEPELVTTPAHPPFLQLQRLEAEGKVNALGKIEATIRQTFRGDTELVLRQAFRRTPQNQWRQLTQLIALNTGYGGEVSEVETADPGDTQDPFWLQYRYARENYISWLGRRGTMRIALPAINIPKVDEKTAASAKPIPLGSPGEYLYRSTMEIPDGVTATPPMAVAISRGYAEYSSSYRVEGGTATIERRLRVLKPEVPRAAQGEYKAFYRVVNQDQAQDLNVLRESTETASVPEGAESDELLASAEQALRRMDFQSAAKTLERVVEEKPDHPSAWSRLGMARLGQMRLEEAVQAFRKQLEVNKYSEDANVLLAMALAMKGDSEEAEAAAKRQLEINPLDFRARYALAQIYRDAKRYAEAVAQLEQVAAQRPADDYIQELLGQAYLEAGQEDKALASFEKLAELNPTPATLNNLAYRLAEKNVHLERAQALAEAAVREAADKLREASLAHVSREMLATENLLVAAWDTLGWVHFKQGELDKAEKYISASWVARQHATVADHLAEVYDRRGQKAKARKLRQLVENAPRPSPSFSEFSQRYLAGQQRQADRIQLKSAEELQNMRTVKLKRKQKINANAEFYVLLGPGPMVEDVRFISGSEELKDFSGTLKTTPFPVEFPDEIPIRLVRRGILSCSQHTSECMFLLYELDRMVMME